jgi:hypothetical protein
MIANVLDEYELKARIAPGLIVAFPVLVDAGYTAPVLTGWPALAAGGVCGLAVIYGLGQVMSARGAAIEPELYRRWGGAPSTRFLRNHDLSLSSDLKSSIRGALGQKLALALLTQAEGAKNPIAEDLAIKEAFQQVRPYLRKYDPAGLWYKKNAEYGFCRNLLGCRVMWLSIALAATVFAIVSGANKGGAFNPASAIGLLSVVCAAFIGWSVLPKITKRAAEAYAQSAWMAFLQSSR